MFSRVRGLVAVGIAALLVGGCGAGASATGSTPDSGLVVHTDAGSVRGSADGSVHRFQGIPYAQPPVGALRWSAPQPPKPWTGVRDVLKPGNRCPQVAGGPGAQASSTEDCLYLNVTTPRGSGAPRPVMVWLHGGEGTGAGADYDPARIVTQGDVDVVTVNYRLGVFGSFAIPQLGSNAGDFGLQDQMAALRWVRANAAAFGGDPHNVTLFGESSGAFATCALLSAPQAKGLVDRAILESSSCSAYFPPNALAPGLGRYTLFTPLAQVQTDGTAAAAKLGCDTASDVLTCLRQVPVKTLLDDGYMDVFATTAYNTPLLPNSPATAMRDGRTAQIPVMFGTNRDELRLYVASTIAAGSPFDASTYQNLLTETYGAQASEVAAAYPAQGTGTYAPALAWAAATTDNGWGCPTVADAKALSDRHQSVYTYLFADENAPNDEGYPTPPGFPLGAAHGLELPLLFGPSPGPAAQQSLATAMIGYWTNFARSGNPNGSGLPAWAAFASGGRVQQLAPGSGGITPVNPTPLYQCALWQKVSP